MEEDRVYLDNYYEVKKENDEELRYYDIPWNGEKIIIAKIMNYAYKVEEQINGEKYAMSPSYKYEFRIVSKYIFFKGTEVPYEVLNNNYFTREQYERVVDALKELNGDNFEDINYRNEVIMDFMKIINNDYKLSFTKYDICSYVFLRKGYYGITFEDSKYKIRKFNEYYDPSDINKMDEENDFDSSYYYETEDIKDAEKEFLDVTN